MRRILFYVSATLLVTTASHAGVFGNVREWLTAEATALLISAVLTILAAILRSLFIKIANTFRETGEFLACLGRAVEDGKITRDELACIIREGKDIFKVWK